jgi:galactosylceramidase
MITIEKTPKILAVIICLALATSPEKPSEVYVVIDGKSPGRVFEGIGALSAGASSRLLIDYPEPQRSDILDILFKPGFAASLHHLKVEIGGDINSTDGSEPSHARTREEFLHPRREYFDRGYEWWLMEEARKRSPQIVLDVLQWGAPPWIGDRDPGVSAPKNRRFFSQDNADFIARFLRGAKAYHGLTIDYCGIWNETPYDVEWIKVLRRTVDTKGLERVRIVAADQTSTVAPVWKIADDILADPELARAVHVIGVHYPSNSTWQFALKEPFASSLEAKKTGKPLWASEDGPWRGDWEGARWLAKIFNRNYVVGRMTKTVIWSLITSYCDNLPIPGSGPMKANTPWSGSYEVQPGIWAIAHTTQFAQPGWQYLDSSCGLLPEGGSFVASRDPNLQDWSMIIETMDAKGPQTLSAHVIGGLPSERINVWKTTESSQFEEQLPITPSEGTFSLKLEPNAIYSLTTTSGQQKGLPQHPIPPASEFPLPYSDDFENEEVGGSPKYLSDLNGAFEIVKHPDGKGTCLSQAVTSLGIDWPLAEQPAPRTITGSRSWIDYEVSCDVRLGGEGWAAVFARFDKVWNSGYWLTISGDGAWKLRANERILAEGRLRDTSASRWHHLSLACKDEQIIGAIDGQQLASVRDTTFKAGFAGLGTGWNRAFFDNFLAH